MGKKGNIAARAGAGAAGGAAGNAIGGPVGGVAGAIVGAIVGDELVDGGKTTVRHIHHVGKKTVWKISGSSQLGNIYFEGIKNGPIYVHPGDYISYGLTTDRGGHTGTITFECHDYRVSYRYGGSMNSSPYLSHHGRTPRMCLNDPADGDVYLLD